MQAWFRYHSGEDLDSRELRAVDRTGLRVRRRYLDIPLMPVNQYRKLQRLARGRVMEAEDLRNDLEGRALSAVTFGTGGATVPQTFLRSLEVNMLAFGGVLQVANVFTTSSGEEMILPYFDDTTNTGADTDESAVAGDDTDPTFGTIKWGAYKAKAGLLKVPFEAFQDSAFDLATIIAEALGERLGRRIAAKCTTGTGGGEATGIVTASSLGVTAASATSIAADEILDLIHSVDPAYRQKNPGFLMHDGIQLLVRKMKNGQGDYLWDQSNNVGDPQRLCTYPVNISMEMASAAVASAKTMLFGQLSKCGVRRVGGVRIYRLVERNRDADQDTVVACVRYDSNMVNAGTPPVKYLQQAAA